MGRLGVLKAEARDGGVLCMHAREAGGGAFGLTCKEAEVAEDVTRHLVRVRVGVRVRVRVRVGVRVRFRMRVKGEW